MAYSVSKASSCGESAAAESSEKKPDIKGEPAEYGFMDFETVARVCPMGIMVMNRLGRATWANPALLTLLGYEWEALIDASPWTALKGSETDEDSLLELCLAVEHARPVWKELTLARADGSPLRARVIIQPSPVRGENGDVSHFICFLEDVTLQRRDQERMNDFMFTLYQLVCEQTDGGGQALSF